MESITGAYLAPVEGSGFKWTQTGQPDSSQVHSLPLPVPHLCGSSISFAGSLFHLVPAGAKADRQALAGQVEGPGGLASCALLTGDRFSDLGWTGLLAEATKRAQT